MRRVMTSLLVAGCIWSSALAFQARSGGAAGGKACALLPREDLKAAGRPVRPGMTCMFGPVMLDLDGLAKPAEVREALRARTKPYETFEPVAGVGDAAFFRANSAWASMYVWTGSHHFTVELGSGSAGDATQGLKSNVVELATGIVAGLR